MPRSARLALAFALIAAVAHAQVPTAPADETRPPAPAAGRLVGHVYERGSTTPLVAATLTAATGETATTDDHGGYNLTLPAGPVEIVIQADRYEALHVKETIVAGEQLTVDYRLLERPEYRGRYTTVVRGEARHEGERVELKGAELTTLPGTSGDPFHAIGSMPGVVQPVPLLPAYVVRGASPGMNGFFLDGMRVPQLFHLVVVEGVVSPQLVDHIDFYPGAYDVSFGRYAGGVVDAATRPGRSDAPYHAQVEVKLYDASALVEARLPGGVTVEGAARYGYPGPLIRLAEPRVDVNYWDYQLRADWKGLTVEALGSYDSLYLDPSLFQGALAQAADQLRITFHRVQIRERYHKGVFDLEAALVGGLDQFNVLSGLGVQKLSLNARVNTHINWRKLRLAAGVDAELSQFTAENFDVSYPGSAPDELGDLSGQRNGIVGSAWANGTLVLDDWLHRPATLTVGARVDTYHAGAVTLLGVDPRATLRYSPIDLFEITAGFGLYQQPPSFPVALPGIDTYALQLGLQRAWQGAVGIKFRLPENWRLSMTGFYERFYNINDVLLDLAPIACTSPPPESLSGLPAQITRQVDGLSYGGELLLRHEVGRVTGWLAYTLSRSERFFSCGLRPADFDQTHVLNLVVQVRLPWHLMAGARLSVQSGRPFTQLSVEDVMTTGAVPPRNNARIPTYVQLDLRVDREWIFQRWALSVFLEALNVTYSEAVYGVDYAYDPSLMIKRYDQPVFEGFHWILPSIGVRGRL